MLPFATLERGYIKLGLVRDNTTQKNVVVTARFDSAAPNFTLLVFSAKQAASYIPLITTTARFIAVFAYMRNLGQLVTTEVPVKETLTLRKVSNAT